MNRWQVLVPYAMPVWLTLAQITFCHQTSSPQPVAKKMNSLIWFTGRMR
ncbi:hypothetical protein AHF37_04478 [Paragonimus kellicotti]|nr:hypothetical protein AHF37_04478 [Paragonimus kellicotti]